MKCRQFENDDQTQLRSLLDNMKRSDSTLEAPERIREELLSAFRNMPKQRRTIWAWRAAAIVACFAIAVVIVQQKPHSTVTPAVAEQSQEITSGFIPLIHGDLSSNSIQVVRVQLPRGSLLQFGLPVNMEREDEMIDAEIIIGEEGLPHAIRFIQETSFSK